MELQAATSLKVVGKLISSLPELDLHSPPSNSEDLPYEFMQQILCPLREYGASFMVLGGKNFL